MKIKIERINEDAILPERANADDAGADLFIIEDVLLKPGIPVVVPLGFRMEIPPGYVGLIHPRSGLASRDAITLINSPGTIDAGYRGPMSVPLVNLGPSVKHLPKGSKVAQLLIQRVELPGFEWAESLSDSTRGEGGYGSTGF